LGRLAGKVAIITGAGNGQGAFEAELFAKEGASVILTDIDIESAQKVAHQISAFGKAIAIHHDIVSKEDWENVLQTTIEAFGKVDILVNNAGIHAETKMDEIEVDEWNRIIDVNLTGTFIGMKKVIPHMKDNGGGAIVNIASIAALRGGSFAHYSAAKGGVRSLSRTAAIEYADQNIRVNSIYPGLIMTDLVKDALGNESIHRNLLNQLPLKRFGQVKDVAYGVLFLASDEAAFITGTELVIDGGTMAGMKLLD